MFKKILLWTETRILLEKFANAVRKVLILHVVHKVQPYALGSELQFLYSKYFSDPKQTT